MFQFEMCTFIIKCKLEIQITLCFVIKINTPFPFSAPEHTPEETVTPQNSQNTDETDTRNECNNNNDNEAMNVNFQADIDESKVYNVVEEMQIVIPINDDIYNNCLNNNNELQKNLNIPDPNEFSNYYNNTFNKNVVDTEDKPEAEADNMNELDLLLNEEPYLTPDVQLEVSDSTLQFQYDASEQFNCIPDMKLPYFDEEASTSKVEYTPDNSDENKYDYENYVMREPSQYFECSTDLPMTLEEIEKDIEDHFKDNPNTESSFYDCLFNDYCVKMTEIENMLESLPNYVKDQNRLLENVDAINPDEPIKNSSASPVPKLQCDICPFVTKTKHGLAVHMRVHVNNTYKCTKCLFKTCKASYLKKHLQFNHRDKYFCPKCSYFTRSGGKLKLHIQKKH